MIFFKNLNLKVKKYKNIIIIIIIILLIIILQNWKHIYHYLLINLFAFYAPATKNPSQKNLSDKIYSLKTDIENEIKIDIKNLNIVNKVNTIEWKNIKDSFNQEKFKEISENYSKPILIKNIFNIDDLKEYNFNDMTKKYGDVIVEAINLDVKENKIDGIEIPFKKFINLINSGKKYYLTVNNSIGNALNKEKIIDFFHMMFDEFGKINMFIGNKNSFTHLHAELAGSCALQLNGIKKWYLIDPKYSDHLHSVQDKSKVYNISMYGFNRKDEIIFNIPRYEVFCEKGDFLYVPPWWWHETLNLTNENIMVSFRPMLFVAPYITNTKFTLSTVVNSLGYNSLIYPFLIKTGITKNKKDDVIKSLQQINNYIPERPKE